MSAPVKNGAILAGAGRASDPPEPAGKDAVRTLNKFLKFARRLPFDYFSEIRLAEISEELMCPEQLLSPLQVYFSAFALPSTASRLQPTGVPAPATRRLSPT